MKIGDILIVILVLLWFVAALWWMFRKKKSGLCAGCSGENCIKCRAHEENDGKVLKKL